MASETKLFSGIEPRDLGFLGFLLVVLAITIIGLIKGFIMLDSGYAEIGQRLFVTMYYLGVMLLAVPLVSIIVHSRKKRETHEGGRAWIWYVVLFVVVSLFIPVFDSLSRGSSSELVAASITAMLIGIPTCLFYWDKVLDGENEFGWWRRPVNTGMFFMLMSDWMCFMVFVFGYAGNRPCATALFTIIYFAVLSLGFAWLYTTFASRRNPWLFRRVLEKGRSTTVVPEGMDALNASSAKTGGKDEAFAYYFLTMLINPAKHTKRIHERISPERGFYSIETLYDFEIPEELNGANVVFPVVSRNANELTCELEFSDKDGRGLQRLSDQAAERCIRNALLLVLGVEKFELCRNVAAKIMGSYSDAEESSAGTKRIKEDASEKLTKESAALVCALLSTYGDVKPVCVRFHAIDKGGDRVFAGIADPKRHCTLKVVRNASLVRVKNNPDGRLAALLRAASRRLTKKRMTFFFNLGNADRAQSYHLTFCGIEDTYLTDVRIVNVSGRSSHFIASKMTLSSLYDQQASRAYIHGGMGFSNAALLFRCEDRSHRSLQAVCAAAAVCFALLCYSGFTYMATNPLEVKGLAPIFFTAVTFAGLLSVWEVLASRKSEEWLWISAFIVVVMPLAALGYIAIVEASNLGAIRENLDLFTGIYWGILMTIGFIVLSATGVVLFNRIKLHGRVINESPGTWSLLDSHNACAKRDSEIDGDLGVVKKVEEGSARTELTGSRPAETELTGTGFAENDPILYRGLIGRHWHDGWLIPEWSSLNDVYCICSKAYRDEVESLLDEYTKG